MLGRPHEMELILTRYLAVADLEQIVENYAVSGASLLYLSDITIPILTNHNLLTAYGCII